MLVPMRRVCFAVTATCTLLTLVACKAGCHDDLLGTAALNCSNFRYAAAGIRIDHHATGSNATAESCHCPSLSIDFHTAMAFDPLTWALGFALTNSVKRLGEKVFGRCLDSDLEGTTVAWIARLGDDKRLSPAALFPTIIEDEGLDQRPALRALRQELVAHRIPTVVQWHSALIEQWIWVKDNLGSDVQSFFQIAEDEARADLRDLALSIVKVCGQDQALFRGTVLQQIGELLDRTKADVSSELPDPFPWDSTPSPRALAQHIEAELPTRVEVILIDQRQAIVHVWATIPGSTLEEIQWSLATMASVVAGVSGCKTIDIGVLESDEMCGTDGCGPIGKMKIRLPLEIVRTAAITKITPPDLWKQARCLVLANDNTPVQCWHVHPFRVVMEAT